MVPPKVGSPAVSAFPHGSGPEGSPTVHELSQLSKLLGVPPAQAADVLAGHCETTAVALTSRALQAAVRGAAAPASEAAEELTNELSSAAWSEQLIALFDAEVAARRPGAKSRTEAMWGSLTDIVSSASTSAASATVGTSSVGAVAPSAALWTAGCPGVDIRLREAAERSTTTKGNIVAPLYILNYIYDGDELIDDDMALTDIETAQYSLHVVGLLLVSATRCAHICDPNACLIPGSNMEFVALPFAPRKGKRTTAISAYDVDQRMTKRRGK